MRRRTTSRSFCPYLMVVTLYYGQNLFRRALKTYVKRAEHCSITTATIGNPRQYVVPNLSESLVVTEGQTWRTAIVLVADQEFVDTIDMGTALVDRWRSYCHFHGYTFIHVNNADWAIKGTDISAVRLLATLDVLPGFDYAVQVSLDTVINDLQRSLTSIFNGRPDVVLSVRENVRGGGIDVTRVFSAAMFPKRPEQVIHPPMIHTELIILRNTPAAKEFAENVLAFAYVISKDGHDMDAIQLAALNFLPASEDVDEMKIFALNVSQQRAVYLLRKDVYGFHGPFEPIPNGCAANCVESLQLLLIFYNITTGLISQQRVWTNNKGKLHVLKEGELIRDLGPKGIALQADFAIHTKKFYKSPLPKYIYNESLT